MNVYDFDGTIYNGDSSVDIYFFLLKRYPKLIAYFPKQILGMVRYKLHLSSKEEMKEMYFSFLKGVQTDKTFVDDFWKQNQNKIKEWYLNQKRKDDVIISASPEFLLKPICDILGMGLVLVNNEAGERILELVKEAQDCLLPKNYKYGVFGVGLQKKPCFHLPGAVKYLKYIERFSSEENAWFFSDKCVPDP